MQTILATWVIEVAILLLPLATATATAQEDRWREHADAGRAAHERGDYAEAERLLRLALSEVERLGKDTPETADVLIDLADLLGELPMFAEAEALAKRALKIRETAFGRNALEVRVPLDSLGMIYRQQGRFAEAEPLLRRALAIVEASPDADAEDRAGALHGLGVLLMDMRKDQESEGLHRRALELY
jgi:tetratricopeptide (TPR) repeat protein